MSSSSEYLTKSIYLVGAHSSGKTTLSRALQKTYSSQTKVLSEVARAVLKEKGYTADDITASRERCTALQMDILLAQFTAEKELVDKGEFFISDRSGVDPILYAKWFYGDASETLQSSDEWAVLKERYQDEKNSLIVILLPVIDFWAEDGVRLVTKSLEEWKNFGATFSGFLDENKIPYKVLDENCKPIEERVSKVKAWLEGKM